MAAVQRSGVAVVAVFVSLFAVGAALPQCGGTRTPKGQTKGSDDGKGQPPAAEQRAEFKIFAFGRVLGTIAPCGCTTEPLGGLQYAFGYIENSSEAKARLVVEPGSFLFPKPQGPEWPADEAAWKQAHARASLLQKRFSNLDASLVSGLGPTDVASPDKFGPLSQYALPRVVANVELPEGQTALPKHKLVTLESGGIQWNVGVTAVVDPAGEGASALGTVTPASEGLSAAVGAMRKDGADFTIALAQGDRAFAESLATAVDGVDLVIVGVVEGIDRERLGTPAAEVGGAFILEPGTQLQTVTQLSISVDASKGAVPKLKSWTVVPPREAIEQELARVTERVKKFKSDPSADKSFVANLERERDRLQASLSEKPKGDAVAVFDQVKVTCKLPVDAAAKHALRDYDATVANQNKARFAGVKPPAPAKGQSGYAGVASCEDCHEEAVEFWKKTPHASAYQTLVDDNKQFDLSCVGCHVTGYRKPGGSEVVENKGLIDVQCEVCHGPGSLHADDGGDDLKLIKLEAPAALCVTECHTEEHSDTFEYDAYMRDIVGPGHGQEVRKKLGDGPTGHELRKAGLDKAGGACKKMM